MNLIDLYGDPLRDEEPLSATIRPQELLDSSVPFLLISLRDRLRVIYPHDLVEIISCGEMVAHPRLANQHVLQFLEMRPYRKQFQFHYQVCFSSALNLLTIRGNYLRNGLFLHLSSKEQQMMTARAAANLSPDLSPLKLTVNTTSGEVALEHSSFIDGNLADAKFKRNIVNLSSRVIYILDLLMKHRFIILYYSPYRHLLLRQHLPLIAKQTEQRIIDVEAMLREVCLKSYEGQKQKIDHAMRRQLMIDMVIHLDSSSQGIIAVMGQSPPPQIPSIVHLANEEYGREELNGLVSKQDEKFDFRVSLQVQLGRNIDWRREEVGGNGIVFSQLTKFTVVDPQHLRRHPQSVYEQRLAKKVDKKGDRESKVSRQLEVISLLGESCHPNLPTFFIDSRQRENCLLTMWEENLSLQHYLKKHSVSMYQLLMMLEQAAKGLLFLHRHNIVHCDFKPANLILCRRLLLRLIDFGQAHSRLKRRSRPGRTFPFAGPQLYTDGEITPALDVYAFGVTVYKCLFGGFMWGTLLKELKRKEGQEQVLPWILPEGLREAGEHRVALVLACLSLKCTAYCPKDRPLLPWIITILQQCRMYLAELQYR